MFLPNLFQLKIVNFSWKLPVFVPLVLPSVYFQNLEKTPHLEMESTQLISGLNY